MEILRYKGFEGTAEVDVAAGMCHGRLLFIADAVTYRADGPRQLQAEFEAAVDDYLETCAELGRAPQKPLNGVFNVRVPPALHRQARLRAVSDDCSLNEVVTQALIGYLHAPAITTPVLEATVERAVERAHSHIAEVARAQVQLGLADALGGARDYYATGVSLSVWRPVIHIRGKGVTDHGGRSIPLPVGRRAVYAHRGR